MARATNPNLRILESAVRRLGPLAEDMVFVGGCATGLLLTDLAVPPVRVTTDVDVIVEIASHLEYHELSDKLRRQDFSEDTSPEPVICRWKKEDTVLDVMPTEREVFGFVNEWYRDAFREAADYELPSGASIRMVTAPYFIATKLAAFHSRGRGDFYMSHDLEDIVAVLDGRPELTEEVGHSESGLREHPGAELTALLGNRDFLDALPGIVLDDSTGQRRDLVLDRIRTIAGFRS